MAGRTRREARAGFALLLAVLTLTGLTLLAHGALLMARHEERISRASVGLLQAGHQAARGIVAAFAVGAPLPPVAPGGGDTVEGGGPAGSFTARRIRLSREWWVVESLGRARAGGARVRLRERGWTLHVPTRVASSRGVVEVGSAAAVEGSARIDGTGVRERASGRSGLACGRWDAPLDSLGVTSLPPTAVVELPGGAPGLGLLAFDTLLARAETLPGARGTPMPMAPLGACLDLPWNWGDPRTEAIVCRTRMVVRGAAGDLEVDGGVGQGLLVVRGDLALNGTDFRGVVLVGGRLRLGEGARLEGLAAAAGGVSVGPASRIVGSACWAAEALEAAEGQLGGIVVPGPGSPPLTLPPE